MTLRYFIYLSFLFLFACTSPTENTENGSGGGENNETKSPTKLVLNNPKALFLSNPPSSSGQSKMDLATCRAASNGKCMKQINQDDMVEDVEFQDKDNNTVPVIVSELSPIGNNYFYAEISKDENSENLKGLIRISDGKIFDITNYASDFYPINGQRNTNMQIEGDYLYSYYPDDKVIYKINLNDLTASAINNPLVDEIWESSTFCPNGWCYQNIGIFHQFLLSNGFVFSETQSGNKIFTPDNSAPVAINYNIIDTGGGTVPGLVKGEDGFIYQIKSTNSSLSCGSTTLVCLIKYEFTNSGIVKTFQGVDNNVTSYSNFRPAKSSYKINDRNRYVLFTNGFYQMTPITNGGVNLNFTSKDLSGIPDGTGNNYPIISGNYVFWKSGSIIYRLELTNSSIPEVFINDSNIIKFEIISGSIVYTKYISGTNIGTYQVSTPGGSSLLLESSDMEVEQIVELIF